MLESLYACCRVRVAHSVCSVCGFLYLVFATSRSVELLLR